MAADNNENLTPYEKWMRLEEAKRNGEDIQFFSNDSKNAKLNLSGKDADRLEKLHTKHGIKLDRDGAADINADRHKRKSGDNTTINNPMLRSTDFGMDDLYGDKGDNFHDAIPSEFHSMHNPLVFGNDEDENRETAYADMFEIYGNATEEGDDGAFDFGHEDYGQTGEDGDADEERVPRTNNPLAAGQRSSLTKRTMEAIGASNPNALKRSSKRLSSGKRNSALKGFLKTEAIQDIETAAANDE